MPDRLNWMDQISKRNDEELRRWTEEISNPRLLTLAMAELSLRSAKRLKVSLDEFKASIDKYSQRVAGLTKALIFLTVALIIVALPSAVSDASKLVRGGPQIVQVATPGRAESANLPSEAQCAAQAGKATEQFVRTQRESQIDFRVLTSENHYNKELRKCLVEIRTVGLQGGDMLLGNYVLDAYENSTQIYCLTPASPGPNAKVQCFDRQGNGISREEADKRIMRLMQQ